MDRTAAPTATATAVTQPTPPSGADLVAALLPSAAFVAANQTAGLTAGIVAASVASATLVIVRRRRNVRPGVLPWLSLAYVVLRAAAGVLTDSDDVYFGLGLALSAATALVVAATAFTAAPAAVHLIPAVVRYSDATRRHPRYRRVAARTTLAWAVAEIALTAWEAGHLAHATATQFVLTRTFVGWPLMAGWICVLIFYIRLRLDPLEHHLAARRARPAVTAGRG